MEHLRQLIVEHAHYAHWYIFLALILAGFNIPVCIDFIIILGAFLAAVVIPEKVFLLYGFILAGCCISAMCAYWTGRLLGPKLSRFKFFQRLMPSSRLERIKNFYARYGMWTFLIGRFIPFGVRNCIFISSGMSKMPFGKFVMIDGLACTLWSAVVFYTFFLLGQNYEVAWHYLKTFNLAIFAAFSVTVIGTIWYKYRKKKPAENASIE